MTKYPTPEEILALGEKLQCPNITNATQQWKDSYFKRWKTKTNEEKIELLNLLIVWLIEIKTKTEKFDNFDIETGNAYAYDPKTKTIYHNINRPSIISSLHELGHFFYGPNELIACGWSVHIFRKVFPNQYKNLKWDKHLLVKVDTPN